MGGDQDNIDPVRPVGRSQVDRSLVQHGAPHPEPLGRADVVMEWAGGLLDRDQGTQTVGARSGLDLKISEF